jgi:RHS repeat-associated protein
VTSTFTYNAASQIDSQTRSNDLYAWNGHYNVNRSYGTNGLNQLTNAGAVISGGLATSSFGRFGYTGQVWLPDVGLNYYKNRVYSPPLGRFMQTDPINAGERIFPADGVKFDLVLPRVRLVEFCHCITK